MHTQISASKIEDSEETKITEETVKSTEDIKQEDALGQSVDIAEQPPTEDSHHELKVSDSGTLTETGRDEPRDEAQDRTSASEGQTGWFEHAHSLRLNTNVIY